VTRRSVWVVEYRRSEPKAEWTPYPVCAFATSRAANRAVRKNRELEKEVPPAFRLKWRVVEYTPKGGEEESDG